MDLQLFIKEGSNYKVLKVPPYVVKNLLRDKLSNSELDRIHRLAGPAQEPKMFKAGSVVVDFSNKTALCFQPKMNFDELELTWTVTNEKITLSNY